MFRDRHPSVRHAALLAALVALVGCATREGSADSAQAPTSDSVAVVALATPVNAPPGLPFGPFHLPDSLLGRPYTSTIRGARNTAEAIATLRAARKAKASVILRLARGSSRFSNPDSSFSLDRWKA